MQALVFESFGSFTNLKLTELPQPKPQAGEVLVEVHASAINPSDAKNVQGLMSHTTLPRVPGRDFAGVVVEGPPDMIGQAVWGTEGKLGFSRHGSHAEYVVVPTKVVQPKPSNLSMAQAGSIGVGYVTAWRAIVDTLAVTAGQMVLIVGGTGAVGNAAIGLAKWRGAVVLTTIRRESQQLAVGQLKPDAIINLEQELLPQAVNRLTGGRGVAAIFDTVGGVMFEPCLQCLASRGRLVEISATGQQQVSLDLLDFYRRELQLCGVNTLSLPPADYARILQQLKPGFESGALQPPVVETYPLEQAIVAYEKVHSRQTSNKVAFKMK